METSKGRPTISKKISVGIITKNKTTTRQGSRGTHPDPYVVTGVKGTQVTAKRRNKVRIRNVEK